ncbi:PREDICTED: putative uncharacterized protein FLJ37770 [Diuraphis noxia]|uniref:putative uncharacterized protein FLJ37770 n=1 Tax=Diuraphis noxia TaxID=143948 RepID=UPI000763919F|nr:PREDICTED: putative uncharacterized protein FLJ37770 [Diuraphis noxia]
MTATKTSTPRSSIPLDTTFSDMSRTSSDQNGFSTLRFLSCEVRSVIRFLAQEGVILTEIHRRLVEAYGPDVMNRQNVTKRVREFREGRMSVHNEERSGRPSFVTDDFIQKVEQFIQEDRCLTLDELLEKKLSARWVPKMLTEERLLFVIEAGRMFLERHDEQGEEFLDSIVTGDET